MYKEINSIKVFWEEKVFGAESVLVVIRKGGKWLLAKNKFRGWEFPGGHREGKETYLETAKREAWEEAHVTLINLRYLGYYILPSGHITAIVLADADRISDSPLEFETCEVACFSELPSDLSFKDGLYQIIIDYIINKETSVVKEIV